MRERAAQFIALAQKQEATGPLMIGHRLMGNSLMLTGDISAGRVHYDQALALYDPAEHRPLATRFGQDALISILSNRSWAFWLLGYPEAALADAEHALKGARESGQVVALMYALFHAALTYIQCGSYVTANAVASELFALAEEKDAVFWKAAGMIQQGCALAPAGKPSDAVQMINTGITARGWGGERQGGYRCTSPI